MAGNKVAMTKYETDMLRRIFVACDTSPLGAPVLMAAARLATELHAELEALFIEDVSLLRLAGLPFATEIDLHSGISRQLDAQVMEKTMRSRAADVRQTLIQAAEHTSLQWSFRVSRGNFVETLMTESEQADLLLIGRESVTQSLTSAGSRVDSIVVIDEGTESVERLAAVAQRLGEGQAARVVVFSTESADEASVATRQNRFPQPIALNVANLIATIRPCHPRFVLLDRSSYFVHEPVFDALLQQLPCPLVLVR